jgi:hypothetical protein
VEGEKLPQQDEPDISKKRIIICWLKAHRPELSLLIFSVIVTALSCVHYISTLLTWTDAGFPLDDSWIHLQFARTIYEGRAWEYSPGYPSTGSTSPLWAIVLTPLFILTDDVNQLIWGVYGIAGVLYAVSSFFAGHLVQNYTENPIWGYFAVFGFVLMPRNTWLMLSGMETPLFMFLLLLSFILLDKPDIKFDPLIGVLAGLVFLARPEGVLIILVCVPVRFLILWKKGLLTFQRIGWLFLIGAIALSVVSAWLEYCVSVTGHFLPDTFYTKVHAPKDWEIEAWNFWWTFWLQKFPFLSLGVGLGLVLIATGKPHPWLFAISLTVLYRFTLTYTSILNNARWLVPIFDLFLISAIAGLGILFEKVSVKTRDINYKNKVEFVYIVAVAFLILIPMISPYVFQADFF